MSGLWVALPLDQILRTTLTQDLHHRFSLQHFILFYLLKMQLNLWVWIYFYISTEVKWVKKFILHVWLCSWNRQLLSLTFKEKKQNKTKQTMKIIKGMTLI